MNESPRPPPGGLAAVNHEWTVTDVNVERL